LLYHERKANSRGFRRIAGLDEAGRGPVAGPVVAASLILKKTRFRARIDDSKKLTPKARELAYGEIREKAWIGIGIVSEKVIDRINIYRATALAMEEAIKNLGVKPDYLLIDGRVKLNCSYEKSHIIRGDSKSLSIAAASIIAKVTRDKIMCRFHKKYPRYGFSCHKGYATREHIRRLMKYGPSPIHRASFNPVKTLIEEAI
jgi:ribonuclease HII